MNVFEEISLRYEYRMPRPFIYACMNKGYKTGIEIGVQRGKNAYNMIQCLNLDNIYCIDPYLNYKGSLDGSQEKQNKIIKESHRRLKRYGDKVIWIKKLSEEAINDVPIVDVIYIDGNHQYKYVMNDLILYYNKVKKGGLLAGHDINIPDVYRAVSKFTVMLSIEDVYIKRKDWWFFKQKQL